MKKFIPWTFLGVVLATAGLFLTAGCKPPKPAPVPPEEKESTQLWRTDLAAAVADAKANDHLLLLNFSGSDWCGWCKRLDAEVFSKDEFKTYADNNLVAVLADFPRRTKQDEALAKQNQRLMEYFKVEGFPTLFLFNSDAELIGQLGYQPGGPKAFIQSIQKVVARSQMAGPNAPARAKLPLE